MDHRMFQRGRITPNLMQADFGTGSYRPLKPGAASHSAPDLSIRSSFKKQPTINQHVVSKNGSVAGSSKSATTIPVSSGTLLRSRFTVPNYGHTKTVRNDDLKLPSPDEMIKQVLQVTSSTFSQGLKIAQLLDVIFCSYEQYPKTQAAEAKLKRTLENLVAKGVVSRSFGSTQSDATYRLTSAECPSWNDKIAMKLAVVGHGIKSVPHHYARGDSLPSGSDFPTRVARNTNLKENAKSSTPANTISKPKLNLGIRSRPYASLSFDDKNKLTKSFAYRVGEIEALRPMEYIPNSPVARNDSFGDDDVGVHTWKSTAINGKANDVVLSNSQPTWDDHEDEQNAALTERFRAYARAINLDCEDNEHVERSRHGSVTKSLQRSQSLSSFSGNQHHGRNNSLTMTMTELLSLNRTSHC